MKKLTLSFLKFYKSFLSPSNYGRHCCRFEPSCADYTHEAVSLHGVVKGGIMGMVRVLKCNPLFKGGYDPVVSTPHSFKPLNLRKKIQSK